MVTGRVTLGLKLTLLLLQRKQTAAVKQHTAQKGTAQSLLLLLQLLLLLPMTLLLWELAVLLQAVQYLPSSRCRQPMRWLPRTAGCRSGSGQQAPLLCALWAGT
jgi:hypothetical protein